MINTRSFFIIVNLQIFHYKNNLKIGFEKCKYILKSTFQNITFVSNMSQARSNVEKTPFFSIEYTMICMF